MTAPSRTSLRLAGDCRALVLKARFGKDRVVPVEPATEAECDLYDSFDGQLAGAGRILVAMPDRLTLLGGDGALEQPAGAPGFVAEMGEGPVQAELATRVSPLRKLIAIAEAQAVRQPIALLDDLDKTLARGECRVLATASGRAVTLIDLCALRGYDKALARLTQALQGMHGARPLEPQDLARQLAPETADHVSKPAIAMTADATASRVATDIIRAHLAVARRNEAGTIADIDTEFLHDYRVALRKVRSVLSLFKGVYADGPTAALKARFGAVMARTGRLRDLDVYLIERAAYLSLVPAPLRPGLDMLFDDFAAERSREQRALAEFLQDADYLREMAELEKTFEKPKKRLKKGPEADRPARALACRLIWKRYRKVCGIAAAIDDRSPDAEVHELRIHCKKLRYLMEFFQPLFPEASIKPLIKALKTLQDTLGTFNDCAVQQDALSDRLDELAATDSARTLEIAKSLGALLTVLDQRQQEARAAVTRSFAAFDAKQTRAGFRTLFKAGEATA